MSGKKWLLSAGHHHLFHIVAPIVARARGYFEQEGAGECEFFCSGSDARTIEGMIRGEYEIGLDPEPYLVCAAQSQGADLKIVGGWLNSPAYAFIAARARGIRSLNDLAGKKISVREPDGIDTRFVRALFRREGLDADSMVQWVVKGSRSRGFQQPVLDSGEADAAMIILQDAWGMVEDGYPMLADLSKVYPQGYAVRITAARGDVVRNEPGRLTGLLRALIRAYRFMNQNYRETMRIVAASGHGLDRDMDPSLWDTKYHMFERIPQDGSVNETGLRLVIEEEKTTGKLPPDFSMEAVLMDRFVKEAAASVRERFGEGCE
ncbi:MAG TPA: ABC transporter substrate-binding protein [candidate division Zixibacteria bacterium]|nr:ABC transporter substrate-binding protein [candidate division Zixibacteria bacterium]